MTKEERINEYNKKIAYCQSVINKYNEKIAEYNQSIADTEEELNVLENIVYKYDYDNDGIVSIIDYNVISLAALNQLNNDPKYNAENKTYNGKSLDIFGNDNDIDISDFMAMGNILNTASKYLDVTTNIKHKQEVNNFISKYHNDNNCLPTLEQVHEYDDSIIDNPLEELVNILDFDGDGIVSIIDRSIIKYAYNIMIPDDDPKYDAENKTYNGKKIDLNEDNYIDITDIVSSIHIFLDKIKPYVDIGGFELYNHNLPNTPAMADEFIYQYYINNNYTWPTLEQVDEYVASLNNE